MRISIRFSLARRVPSGICRIRGKNLGVSERRRRRRPRPRSFFRLWEPKSCVLLPRRYRGGGEKKSFRNQIVWKCGLNRRMFAWGWNNNCLSEFSSCFSKCECRVDLGQVYTESFYRWRVVKNFNIT